MKKTKLQEMELDKIEKKILIALFGNENIPENTALVLRFMKVNPNEYIQKFESFMLPFMKENGIIDGVVLHRIIQFSKYKDALNLIQIPETDFYLSEVVNSFISAFLPGLKDKMEVYENVNS